MEESAFGIIKEDFEEMLQKMNNERLGQMAKQIVSSPRNQEQFKKEEFSRFGVGFGSYKHVLMAVDSSTALDNKK